MRVVKHPRWRWNAFVNDRLEATLRRRRLVQDRDVVGGEQSITTPVTCKKTTGFVWMIIGDVALDRPTYLQWDDDFSYDPREHGGIYWRLGDSPFDWPVDWPGGIARVLADIDERIQAVWT